MYKTTSRFLQRHRPQGIQLSRKEKAAKKKAEQQKMAQLPYTIHAKIVDPSAAPSPGTITILGQKKRRKSIHKS